MSKTKTKTAAKALPGQPDRWAGKYDSGISAALIKNRDVAGTLRQLRAGSAGIGTAFLCIVSAQVAELGKVDPGGCVEYPRGDLDPTGKVWLRLEKPWGDPAAGANLLMDGQNGVPELSAASIVLNRGL